MDVSGADPTALNGIFDAVLWMGVLLVVVGAGVGVVLGVRRKLLRGSERNATHLSLDGLSRLRDAGGVSETEYAAIRKAVIREISPSSPAASSPASSAQVRSPRDAAGGTGDKRVQQPGRS